MNDRPNGASDEAHDDPTQAHKRSRLGRPRTRAEQRIEALDASPAALADEIAGLRDELQRAAAEAADHKAGWQRAAADFANFRRRTEEERSREAGIANDYTALSEEQAAKARASRRIEPIVRRHPNSRCKGLYLGTMAFESIEDLPLDEGRSLMSDLVDYATGEPFRHAHRWRRNDLVIWDNRGLMHVATPYDKVNDRRIVHRLSIEGAPPI